MNQDTRTPESATSTDEGYKRRDFLKITSTVAAGTGLATVGMSLAPKDANAHAYAPYYTDDQLTTVAVSYTHLTLPTSDLV